MPKVYSTSPYYDDFDQTKKFYRILFRPGRAVQARELTQLQTILQNQIEQFGKNVYKEGSRISGGEVFVLNGSYIKIQEIQNLDIDLPTNYGKPVIVPSGEFQKLCKDMNNIGTTINILSKGFYVKFLCNAGSVYSREVVFGEVDDEDDDEPDPNMIENEYNEDFDTEQLIRIAKISGLSTNMQMFPKQDQPLLFRSNIGNIGKISIFIKSKNQIDKENLTIEPETE